MKTAVILEATSNQGKSSTLRYLAKLFQQKSSNFSILEGSLDEGDFIATFTYENKLIAIVSFGDNGELLQKLTKLYKENAVDLLYGASRTKGATIEVLYKISAQHDVHIIWTTTYKTDKKDKMDSLNQIRANELMRLASHILKENNGTH